MSLVHEGVVFCLLSATVVADPTNSFISQSKIEGNSDGPLSGLTLAVKDLFDVSVKQQLYAVPKQWAHVYDQ